MRDMPVSSCSPDWGHVERTVDEDAYKQAFFSGSIVVVQGSSLPVSSFVDPPAMCLNGAGS